MEGFFVVVFMFLSLLVPFWFFSPASPDAWTLGLLFCGVKFFLIFCLFPLPCDAFYGMGRKMGRV